MGKELDPVCGMAVDTERTPHKTVYKGKIYYFCSRKCLSDFERDAEHYLRHGPRGMM